MDMKFIKFSFWMSAFGTLVFLGLNFSKPDQASMARSQGIRHKITGQSPGQPAQPKRFVKIEGKHYEYNPKNVYNVNGVSTYYKPSKHELAEPANLQQQVQQAARQAGVQGNVNLQQTSTGALEKVHRMADSGALSVYSPGGPQALIEAANEARQKAEERTRALNQLMNE